MAKRQQREIKANKRGLKAPERGYRQHKIAHCFKGTLKLSKGGLPLPKILEIGKHLFSEVKND